MELISLSPGLSRDLPPLCSSDVTTLNTRKFAAKVFTKINLRCNCSSNRPGGGSNPGENGSKIVLDAFFLGKALGEALTERIESTAGEFLSALDRLQAEQQKRRSWKELKEPRREQHAKAMEAQGLNSKSSIAIDALTPAFSPPPLSSSNASIGDTGLDSMKEDYFYYFYGFSNDD